MTIEKSSTYFSNGNLLIAGEYFVLEGAKAFAVPLKYGQEMHVDILENKNNTIHWSVQELSKPLFNATFDTEELEITGTDIDERSLRLQQILRALKSLKPDVFSWDKSYRIRCNIEFSLNWGWGSSSTLICNLSSWAGTDPFRLNRLVSSGSGYDIAASASLTPVFYRLVEEKQSIEPATFNPPFKENIVFVYTGRKQNTQDSIIRNISSVRKNRNMIPVISWLSEKMSCEKNTEEFNGYIAEHEKILSRVLNLQRIKEKYFKDFNGELKSLGAWEGDFIMAVSPESSEYIIKYFKAKGLDTLFRFDEIIRSGNSG